MESLESIRLRHTGRCSDKWSSYLQAYDRLFSDFRIKPIRLLEIGIQHGGSLEIWAKYFPIASAIVGCDISQESASLVYREPNISVVTGDANLPEVSFHIASKFGPFDIVIDDGSHNARDIVGCFARYFPYLRDGGVYVVEDLHCSYWRQWGGGLFSPYSSMAFFKLLADLVNQEHWAGSISPDCLPHDILSHYNAKLSKSEVLRVHAVEFRNSLCAVWKQSIDNNSLGSRSVCGTTTLFDDPLLLGSNGATYEHGSFEEDALSLRQEKERPTVETVTRLDQDNSALEFSTLKIRELLKDVKQLEANDRALQRQSNFMALRIKELETERKILLQEQQSRTRAEIQRVKDLQRTIDTLLTSTCWRITRPVRLLGDAFTTLQKFVRRAHVSIAVFRRHWNTSLFDKVWYLASNSRVPHWAAFAHFCFVGIFNGRAPNGSFDEFFYVKRNPQASKSNLPPLLHFALHGFAENLASGLFDGPQADVAEQLLSVAREQQVGSPGSNSPDIRCIAFYLPQFHAIPENDAWWGKGFTEWTNVRRGRPIYYDHYQPHVPHPDLGYYDLNDVEVLEKQASLARSAGIEGFCFYYYWFNGKRLLEMPTDRILKTGRPDFPFCFCWANENWTRRWDGRNEEILIEQRHSIDDDEAFVRGLLSAFRDPRYIRVNGKPLLLVYRAGLLPNPRRTAETWRRICRAEGIGELCLAYVQSFDNRPPQELGFDRAIQFPPLLSNVAELKPQFSAEQASVFRGKVFDYRATAHWFVNQFGEDTTWPGIFPSWDNTARRGRSSHSWLHASPENYFCWLKETADYLRWKLPQSERLIFINAWNEWAEGCHLEPDEKYGCAWLNATRLALMGTPLPKSLRVLAIGHNAFRAGAQIVLLQLLRELRESGQVELRLLLRGAGALRESYEDLVETDLLTDNEPGEIRAAKLDRLLAWEPDVILSNTVANGPLLAEIAAKTTHPIPVITHVHELQKSIERWAAGEIMQETIRHSDHFIAVSEPVQDNLLSTHAVPQERLSLIYEFIECRNLGYPDARFVSSKRGGLGLDNNDFVVAGCGTTDWRKGPDLFIATAEKVIQENPDARFIWIGALSDDDGTLRARIDKARLGEKLRFLGERSDARECLACADVFFLSSREDPFPLVALEAADAAVPIVAFADSGGMPDFVADGAGIVVPFEDTTAAAEAILRLGRSYPLCHKLGDRGRSKVRRLHGSRQAARSILRLLGDAAAGTASNSSRVKQPARTEGAVLSPSPRKKKRTCVKSTSPLVTVILPNYNHAPFLNERLESIVNQGIDDMEILLMDDCSRDVSPQILKNFCRRDSRARLLTNATNSGSTFRQWKKGLSEARGEFVWIAESDDSADPELLQSLLTLHERNAGMVLCYAQSLMMDLSSRPYGPATTWTDDIDAERWKKDYVAHGLEELAIALSVKNTIPNVSAVLFRNVPVLRELIDENMRLCADWLSYVRLCGYGDIGYCHRPLNRWRLASSNARSKPPGETECQEGARIYDEIGRLLRWSNDEMQHRREEFRRKCEAWKEAA